MPEGYDGFPRFVFLPVLYKISDTAPQAVCDNPVPARNAHTFQAYLLNLRFYPESSAKPLVLFPDKIEKDTTQYRANPVQQAADT